MIIDFKNKMKVIPCVLFKCAVPLNEKQLKFLCVYGMVDTGCYKLCKFVSEELDGGRYFKRLPF